MGRYTAILALLAAYRVLYHVAYVAVSPFALATFSDGAVYERAARDLLAHPPLGSEPFYLQGLYAGLLATGMAVSQHLLGGLLLQLALAAAALGAGTWALTKAFGGRAGLCSGIFLLGYFPLAFYENKYLSASLGVSANLSVWVAFAHWARRRDARAAAWVGLTSGLSVLARPNLLLAVPFTLGAMGMLSEAGPRRRRTLLTCGLWFAAALAPMAMRNLWVTGSPSILRAPGGGIEFYVGNNPHANGVWNNAGGLLSGEVTLETRELLDVLELPSRGLSEDAAAVGRALYARGLAHIREEPAAWLALEARKLWLTLGNDELSQDYDPLGERALLPSGFGWGVPFGALLALACVGAFAVFGARRERTDASAWLLLLGGQAVAVLAANLVYFTSSQHRLPLAVVAAALSGPGLLALSEALRGEHRSVLRGWVLGLALLLGVQAFLPRSGRSEPSAAHYYNLFVVEEQLGHLPEAALALQQVLTRHPQHAVSRLELATLMRRLGQFPVALGMLDELSEMADTPAWVRTREQVERRLAEQGRRDSSRAP